MVTDDINMKTIVENVFNSAEYSDQRAAKRLDVLL